MIIRTKKKKKTIRKIVTISVFIAVIAAAYLTGRLLPTGFADYYSSRIFPVVASVPQKISSMTRVSISEAAVVVLGCLALPLLILWIVLLVKKALTRGVGKYLYQSLRNALAVTMVFMIIFEIFHGFNYRRTPARVMMELGTGRHTVEELFAAYEWAYEGMLKARSELKENEMGVAQITTDFNGVADYASSAVDSFCRKYGVSSSTCYARAKSVKLSHYWSWTYIVGMYNPINGEANINTDYMDITSIPTTVCHELCHAKGFANETDCNLIGALACVTSERADFRYAGYYAVFISLLSEINKLSKTYGIEYDTHVGDKAIIPVARDIKASSDYWDGIDKEVLKMQKRFGINITEQALAANNKFLQSNGEKEGNDTYIVPENAYVDFYLKYYSPKGK